MRKKLIFIVALCLSIFLCIGLCGEIKEESTEVMFQETSQATQNEQEFSLDCAGVGVRKKFFVKVYGVGFYVGQEYRNKMKESWKSRITNINKLVKNDDFFKALVHDSYCRQVVMRFVRNVGAEKIRDSFFEGLEDNLSELSSNNDLKKAAETFVAWFQNEVKEGDTLVLTIFPDGTLQGVHNSKKVGSLQNSRLCQGVTAIWLGEECISSGLKKDLVRLFYK